MQLVFDADYRVIDLVDNFPGSVHDAQILNMSGLKCLFEDNRIPQAAFQHSLVLCNKPCQH
ncbi:hypothetical protein E2C01_060513 [Portunus trituberculatus]|uniref:DDE Tnp4 domain-containing protein n=1 Tax=Portunus trituberculatus TaxID=210409 RepID=A0A5B7H8X2_PORTR|nr:hypothetical protein [Portunus trituberculatus]